MNNRKSRDFANTGRSRIWLAPLFTFLVLSLIFSSSLSETHASPLTIVKNNSLERLAAQQFSPPATPGKELAEEGQQEAEVTPAGEDSVDSQENTQPKPEAAPAPKAKTKPVVDSTSKPSAKPNNTGSDRFSTLFTIAKKYLGVPYVYGGNDPKRGLDCSSFTQLVFRQIGINLPRTTYTQIKMGKPVGFNELKPGDLVFFDSAGQGSPTHVGIYIGGSQMIHESEPKVQISPINTPFRKRTFFGARRIL